MHSNNAGPVGTPALAMGQQDQATRMRETGAADQSLDQFTGPVEQTPFYRSMVTQGRESTDRAYNNARAGVRANANAAGFGYTSPMTQGGDAAMRVQQAGDEARVPGQAMTATAPLVLGAANTRAGIANSFNPAPIMGVAQRGVDSNNAVNAGMFQALGNLGGQAMKFIPGYPKPSSGT